MSERRSEAAQTWTCPDCPWTHTAHPAYGWGARDDRAVEVHQTTLCPWRKIEPCRLGYQEHDGARYCFAHGGFLEAGVQSCHCNRVLTTPTAQPDGEASA